MAKDSFDVATTLWDQGNYSDAVDSYMDAEQEYGLASDHYKNMMKYATNQSDRDFADDISQSTYTLSLASANFANAAGESNNTSSAYAYFQKGQDLMNQSDDLMNRSMEPDAVMARGRQRQLSRLRMAFGLFFIVLEKLQVQHGGDQVKRAGRNVRQQVSAP